MKELLLFFLLFPSPLFSRTTFLDLPWDTQSHPDIMALGREKRFYELPLKGQSKLKNKLWSGNYWPLKEGNINVRWYSKKRDGRKYLSPTREEIRKLSIPELAQLSPSEKYDVFLGRYDYPLKHEVEGIANPDALPWEGICHGWSPASMNHIEPTPKLMRNPDGFEIPFGSTDIKALLSYYYAFHHKVLDTHQMGRRCFDEARRISEKDCDEDLNAGAFHIILANKIGIEGTSFVMDIQRSKEVWNHPVYSYEIRILRELVSPISPAPGTEKQIEVEAKIQVIEENGYNWGPVLGTTKQGFRRILYRYLLDLNAEGEIIGGKWTTAERPDFLWIMRPPYKFEGHLKKLAELLDDP